MNTIPPKNKESGLKFIEKYRDALHYLALLILIYTVFFLKLGSFHLRWWDESVFAINTYEMLHNGRYFSLYFDGHPDFFNLKPPFTSWVQLLFVKMFGYNELSLRLPSAIAAGISVLVVFNFVSKNFSKLWAWTGVLILITSSGFITFHTARTADADALLTLFLLMSNLYFLRIVTYRKNKDMVLFFVFFIVAFFTKSFAALFFTPAYLFYLIHQKQFKQFVFNWVFIAGSVLTILLSVGLFYLRELDTPGYLNALFFSDISRIYTDIWSEHKHETLFYFYNLFTVRFANWSVLLSLGLVFLFFNPIPSQKRNLFFFFLLIFAYLLVITSSVTKLLWYDMPLYPYMAIIAAYPLYILINNVSVLNKSFPLYTKYMIVVLVFLYPYVMSFNRSQANTIENAERFAESLENYLHHKSQKNESVDGTKVLYGGWNGSLLFYKHKFAEKQQHIELVTGINSIAPNDDVLVSNDSLDDLLQRRFDMQLLETRLSAKLYKVRGIRE